MNQGFASFQKQVMNPLKFRLFLLKKLPSAYFAGLRIKEFNEHKAVITVRYKWFTQNPFRSMYFAVQSMAAEMSTGLLALGQIYHRDPAVSMLVVGLEAKFFKKATDLISFTCTEGDAIDKVIEESVTSGEARVITCRSIGTNEAGEQVSEFLITWSIKVKTSPVTPKGA